VTSTIDLGTLGTDPAGNGDGPAADHFASSFVRESIELLGKLDLAQVDAVKRELVDVKRRGGRLFIIGSGGGAGHASHAVNDFRKIAGIESYSPSDNVSELTARINDEGWDTSYSAWLAGSRIDADDMILVFSVGGGDIERNVSPNLVNCLRLAKQVGARIAGIVGRDGGATEGMQAVVWHLLVSDPEIAVETTKWESITPR